MNNYLSETKLLDFSNPIIQKLINTRGWQKLDTFNCVKQIYSFVKDDVLFGYNVDDNISASKVLNDGIGQCNTKSILFMALLRSCQIPCRIHGFTINKKLQQGAMTGITYKLAPCNVFHSWVEVLVNNEWLELEGLILDKQYLSSLLYMLNYPKGPFLGYGIAVDDISKIQVEFNGTSTYIQSKGINNDFGVYDSPDELLAEHQQSINAIKKLAYMYYGRRVMNKNVKKIRLKQFKNN